MSYAYRSAYQHIVGMRLAELKLARDMVEPLLPRIRSIEAARVARTLAGGVGIAGALSMVILACFGDTGDPSYALVGSGAAAIATYVLARGVLALAGRFHRASPPLPRLTGELEVDLARIDASNPLRAIDQRVGELETWSTALPLAAISLLMPLTLHYAFAAVIAPDTAESFANWIRLSLVLVGHAHLALMALAIAFARKMKKATSEELAQMPIHREWAKVWGLTIGVSALPGIVLIAIPPILTALTGIAFIPFMFTLMRRCVMNERSVLELADEAVRVRVEADAPSAMAALDEAAWREVAITHDAVTSARGS